MNRSIIMGTSPKSQFICYSGSWPKLINCNWCFQWKSILYLNSRSWPELISHNCGASHTWKVLLVEYPILGQFVCWLAASCRNTVGSWWDWTRTKCKMLKSGLKSLTSTKCKMLKSNKKAYKCFLHLKGAFSRVLNIRLVCWLVASCGDTVWSWWDRTQTKCKMLKSELKSL